MLQVYQSAGGHLEDLQRRIQTFTKASDAEVKAIFEDAGIRAWEADDAFYVEQGFPSVPLLQSESMVRLLTDTYQRTNGEIHNFTRTTAKASQQRLINLLDTAHFRVMSGAQSYTAAVKDAVNDIVSQQSKVCYPTGHVDTIETAVLRAVRTGVAQASGNMSLQRLPIAPPIYRTPRKSLTVPGGPSEILVGDLYAAHGISGFVARERPFLYKTTFPVRVSPSLSGAGVQFL